MMSLPDEKPCKDCGETKPASEFYKSKRGNKRLYLSSYCKACSKVRARKDERRRIDANHAKLWEHYRDNPCVDCGEDNPLKLSLDHRDEKNHGITDIMHKQWHHVVSELALCDVRCHNCHAVRTAAQLNYYATKSLRDYVTKWPENQRAYDKGQE